MDIVGGEGARLGVPAIVQGICLVREEQHREERPVVLAPGLVRDRIPVDDPALLVV